MPFYEYECTHCHFYCEVMQKISDAPLKKCPSCGRNAFKKLLSAPVFRLKGSGWYETDFKSGEERKRNLASAEKEEAAAGTAKTEGKAAESTSGGESKTESKPVKAGEGAAAPVKAAASPSHESARGRRTPSRGASHAKPARKRAARSRTRGARGGR